MAETAFLREIIVYLCGFQRVATSCRNRRCVLMPWYVLRDLTRSNALEPGYKKLRAAGFEVFTPMKPHIITRLGRKIRSEIPVIHDLLFVKTDRETLDPVINLIPTLQYRFVKGGKYCQAMEVPEPEMERFINAVNHTDSPRYYSPEELSSSMIGRKVRIIGGPLHGYEGSLLSVKGLRKKYILIGIPDMITAAIEVAPDLIEFI